MCVYVWAHHIAIQKVVWKVYVECVFVSSTASTAVVSPTTNANVRSLADFVLQKKEDDF